MADAAGDDLTEFAEDRPRGLARVRFAPTMRGRAQGRGHQARRQLRVAGLGHLSQREHHSDEIHEPGGYSRLTGGRSLTGTEMPCDSKNTPSITVEETAMRITSKGQVTIPVDIRERLGLLPNSEVDFEVEGTAVRIRKTRGRRNRGRGRSIVEHLRGKATSGMTTNQIMALTRGER